MDEHAADRAVVDRVVDQQSTSGIPRPVLTVMITLGVLLAVGVAGLGLFTSYTAQQESQAVHAQEQARRTGPLALPPIPAPKAETPECSTVLAALPREIVVHGARVPRRAIAEPAPAGAVAWGDAQHDPITVRCGIDAPAELTPTSRLTDVSGVGWLKLAEGSTTSWLAADRPVFVALTVPDRSGTGPLQDISTLLKDRLPKQDIFP